MDAFTQPGSPKAPAPEVQDSMPLPPEFCEAPFERWLRLADDLLRDWPGTRTAPSGERKI